MRGALLAGLWVVLLGLVSACVVGPALDSRGPATLEEAAALAPEGAPRASIHLVIQADQALERGELGRAREIASRALRIDGRNPYAYLVLGQVAAESGEQDAALRYLEQAQLLFSLDPAGNTRGIARVLRLEADLRSQAGDVEGAALLRRQADALEAGEDRPGSLLGPVLERQP